MKGTREPGLLAQNQGSPITLSGLKEKQRRKGIINNKNSNMQILKN
jgi:hypothetical protein